MDQQWSGSQVESMRSLVSVTSYQGMRTEARELHVRMRGGREKLWYVCSTDPDEPRFVDAIERAFRARSSGTVRLAGVLEA